MNIEQALELEFDDYILWCHNHMNRAAARDIIIADIWDGTHSPEMRIILEARWSRRYWFHRNGAFKPNYIMEGEA